MTTELLDNDFKEEGQLHPFERLGFKIVKKSDSRVWAGKSNIYLESKTFEKRDHLLGEWCINIEARKGATGLITFNRINGYIKLLVELSQLKRSIKSKNRFWLFRKPKNLIDKYYLVEPPIYTNDLQNLLLEINQCNIDIKVERGIMNFEFNFESFIDENYEQVIKILGLFVTKENDIKS